MHGRRDSTFDTVVIDVDGTLVDSVYVHVGAWAQAFRSVGLSVPSWLIHRAIGTGGDRLVAHVAGEVAEHALGDEIRRLHDEAFAQEVDHVAPLPGAADLLTALRRRSVRIVVASSGAPEQTDALLARVGERELLHTVISAADADATKPAPDLVAVAMRRAASSRALVVGDAVWDVHSSIDAGQDCVGLRSGGISGSELHEAGARWVYDDTADLLAHLDDVLGA